MLKRNTVTLAALALILVVGTLVVDRIQSQSEAVTGIVEMVPDQVQSLQVNDVQLQRQGSQWQITAPIASPADSNTVSELLRTLANLKPTTTLDEVKALAEFGLDPARATITYAAADQDPQTVQVGSPTFDRSAVYALLPSQSVVTLPVTDEYALTPDLFRLRDRHVLTINPAEVTRLDVKPKARTTPPITLERQDLQWQITAPQTLPANPTAVTQVLQKVQTAQATAFLSEARPDAATLKTYGLDQPSLTLTVTNKTGDPATLQLGPEQDGTIHALSTRQGGVMTVAASLLSDLTLTVEALREKRLAVITPSDLAEIRISAADSSLTRALTPIPDTGEWMLSDQPERQVDIAGLLAPLGSEVSTFVPAKDAQAATALKQPILTLMFLPRPDLNRDPQTLVLAKDARDPNKVYGRSSTQPDIGVTDSATLDSLLAVITALKPLEAATP